MHTALVPRDAAAQAPPTVLQREVAAPAGCRTVVTQSCRRVPRAVTRKLAEEECEQVPDTVCHTRLEKVGSRVIVLLSMFNRGIYLKAKWPQCPHYDGY